MSVLLYSKFGLGPEWAIFLAFSAALTVLAFIDLDHRILPDEPASIRKVVREWSRNRQVQAMILTGGTGISPRDGTPEVVERLLMKRLDGFGELFRLLSYRQIGPAAFLSRAVAGVCGKKALFCLPGSEKGVTLAMDRLILPELGHLIQQLQTKR